MLTQASFLIRILAISFTLTLALVPVGCAQRPDRASADATATTTVMYRPSSELRQSARHTNDPDLLSAIIQRLEQLENNESRSYDQLLNVWNGENPLTQNSRVSGSILAILVQIPKPERRSLKEYKTAIDKLTELAVKKTPSAGDDALRWVLCTVCVNALLDQFPTRAQLGCAERAAAVALKKSLLDDLADLHTRGVDLKAQLELEATLEPALPKLRTALVSYENFLFQQFLMTGPLVIQHANDDAGLKKFFEWFRLQGPRSRPYRDLCMPTISDRPTHQLTRSIAIAADSISMPALDGSPTFALEDIYSIVPWPYSLAEHMELGELRATYSVSAQPSTTAASSSDTVDLVPILKFNITFVFRTEPEIRTLVATYSFTLDSFSLDWNLAIANDDANWIRELLVNKATLTRALAQFQTAESRRRIIESILTSGKGRSRSLPSDSLVVTRIARYLEKAILPREQRNEAANDARPGVAENEAASRTHPSSATSATDRQPDAPNICLYERLTDLLQGESDAASQRKKLMADQMKIIRMIRLVQKQSSLPSEVEPSTVALPAAERQPGRIPISQSSATRLTESYVENYRDDLITSFYDMLNQSNPDAVYPVLSGLLGDERETAALMAGEIIHIWEFVEDCIEIQTAQKSPHYRMVNMALHDLEHDCLEIFREDFVARQSTRLPAVNPWWRYWEVTEINKAHAADYIDVCLNRPSGTEAGARVDLIGVLMRGVLPDHANKLEPDYEVLDKLVKAVWGPEKGPVLAALRFSQAIKTRER